MCFDPIMLCTCRLGGRGPRYSSHENNFVFSRRSTLLTLFTRIASCDHCTSFQYDKLQWLSLSSSRWQKERWGRFSQNSAANSALKIPTGLPPLPLPPPPHPNHQTKKSSLAFDTDFRFTIQPQIYCSHFSEFGARLIGWLSFFFHCSRWLVQYVQLFYRFLSHFKLYCVCNSKSQIVANSMSQASA